MEKIHGAVIKEQGVTFAIVVVKSHVFNTPDSRDEAANAFSVFFPGMPIILMRQDSQGTPEYFGRKDIVNFLSNIDPARIPWQEYTFNS